MNWISTYFASLWQVSLEAGPFLLVGFGVAALLHRYIPAEWMVRLLGKGRWRSMVTAAFVGAPLPLCSCSVVPTALAIQKKGARKSATLAFFISTPETGVDSIAITYGMMGPYGLVMAVTRPLAASLSAILAGASLECLSDPRQDRGTNSEESCRALRKEQESECAGNGPELIEADSKGDESSLLAEARGLRQSFFMLFDEIAGWILLGLVLSGAVAAFLPAEVVERHLGEGWKGMAAAIVIGVPIYVCATATTPLAAVLMTKGLSAGAALVFLLVGPATNLGTIIIVAKMLGRKALLAYLVSIIVVSVSFGIAIDFLHPQHSFQFAEMGGSQNNLLTFFLAIFAGIVWFLLLYRTWLNLRGKG